MKTIFLNLTISTKKPLNAIFTTINNPPNIYKYKILKYTMKRASLYLSILCLSIILIPIVSSSIIINQQPEKLYNLGEVIKTPIKITAADEINDFFTVQLICNGNENEIHKQYIYLLPGEEQDITTTIPLKTSFIGRTTGKCVIKSILNDEYKLTKEFKISDKIIVEPEIEKKEYLPEQSITIEGTAVKENGENSEGYVDITVYKGNLSEVMKITDTVNNGYFFLNFSLPKDTKSGQYLVGIDVYEKDRTDNRTNKGYSDFNIKIGQVPTNLEINFDKKEILSGETLKVKTILHDQTGEKIDSTSIVKIYNEKEELLEQKEISTDKFLEYPIDYKEPAAEWNIVAKSNDIENEANFKILENENVSIELINGTVILTNTGNVPYNDTVLIKLGNESIPLDALIPIGKKQKYSLTAPDGEYQVEIISGDNNAIKKKVVLTGRAISVKESSLFNIQSSIVWLFVVIILGFVAFTIYRKGYKKTFFGRMIHRKNKRKSISDKKAIPSSSLITTPHRALLSLSIKGHKQNASVVCLRLKNHKKLIKNKKNIKITKEVLQKVEEIAENEKASIYENKENMFLIFAPAKTKTFKNQKKAITTAQEISELLEKYNKLAKLKIHFGISVNYGTIVAKHKKNILQFMSMGTLITTAKKIAQHSKGKVLLGKNIYEKVRTHITGKKHEVGKTTMYSIKKVRYRSKENKKFINNFVKKLKKDQAKQENSKK